jgi:hypothetical protein
MAYIKVLILSLTGEAKFSDSSVAKPANIRTLALPGQNFRGYPLHKPAEDNEYK